MNFFSKKTTWMNVEFIVFKLAIATAFLLIGSYFHNFIHTIWLPILIICVITISWTLALWIKKMKQENHTS